MILFVNDNTGILFLRKTGAIIKVITEVIYKNSFITNLLNIKSPINGSDN